MKKYLKGIRGKQILISGLAVLVMVAGYYRWTVNQEGDAVTVMTDNAAESQQETDAVAEIPVEETYGDYFARARYERDCARSEAAELLSVSTTDEGVSAHNTEKLEQLAKNTEDETMIENMVIAKGYLDCVAFVDEEGVRVVVKSDTLEAEGVAQIKDIVVEQTGAKTTDIKISNKN